jgi:hypothetical protein
MAKVHPKKYFNFFKILNQAKDKNHKKVVPVEMLPKDLLSCLAVRKNENSTKIVLMECIFLFIIIFACKTLILCSLCSFLTELLNHFEKFQWLNNSENKKKHKEHKKHQII